MLSNKNAVLASTVHTYVYSCSITSFFFFFLLIIHTSWYYSWYCWCWCGWHIVKPLQIYMSVTHPLPSFHTFPGQSLTWPGPARPHLTSHHSIFSWGYVEGYDGGGSTTWVKLPVKLMQGGEGRGGCPGCEVRVICRCVPRSNPAGTGQIRSCQVNHTYI